MHSMELLGDVGHVECHLFLVETLLVSVQDRCMVCASNEALVEAHFGPLGDSANLDAR